MGRRTKCMKQSTQKWSLMYHYFARIMVSVCCKVVICSCIYTRAHIFLCVCLCLPVPMCVPKCMCACVRAWCHVARMITIRDVSWYVISWYNTIVCLIPWCWTPVVSVKRRQLQVILVNFDNSYSTKGAICKQCSFLQTVPVQLQTRRKLFFSCIRLSGFWVTPLTWSSIFCRMMRMSRAA